MEAGEVFWIFKINKSLFAIMLLYYYFNFLHTIFQMPFFANFKEFN